MSDAYEDLVASVCLESTYCKKHKGMWPHECGCDQDEYEDEKE